MEALEVADLRLVAGVHEDVKGASDQLGDTTAEHHLLTEQVGLALLGERRLDHAGPRTTQAIGVGQGQRLGAARRVLLDGDKARHATALHVGPANQVPGALGGDHDHVHVGRGLDQVEPDVEAVGERQGVAGLEVGGNVLLVDGSLIGVGQQEHDHVSPRRGVGKRPYDEAGL